MRKDDSSKFENTPQQSSTRYSRVHIYFEMGMCSMRFSKAIFLIVLTLRFGYPDRLRGGRFHRAQT